MTVSKMRPIAHLSRAIITSVISRAQSARNIAINRFRALKIDGSGWIMACNNASVITG
jgi:hypothetical protein